MKRKLIAFDIDGTLLTNDKKVLPGTLDALRELRNQGHLVTLATGRSRFMAQPVIRELHFNNYVLCNGSAAFLNHRQVYKHLLDEEQLAAFVLEAQEMGIDTAFVSMDDMRRDSSNNVLMMDEALNSFGVPVPELGYLFNEKQEIYQALAFYGTDMDGIFEEKYPAFSFVRWHENGLDIVPRGGSKATTLLHLAESVGISRDDVITFGDGNNDKEMLAMAGVGVAMGNAAADVQQHADLVTDTNEKDGIIKALKLLKLI